MWPFTSKKSWSWELHKIVRSDGSLLGSALIRMGVRRDRQLSDLVYISIRYEHRPLPSSAEFDEIERLELDLEEFLENTSAELIGHVTFDGKRDWILYVAEGRSFAQLAYERFSSRGIEIEVQRDPRWEQYRDLLEMRSKR